MRAPGLIMLAGAALLAGLVACSDTPRPEAADIVLMGGGIYTVDADRSWAEAAAIRGGEIDAVGDDVWNTARTRRHYRTASRHRFQQDES